MRAWDDRSKLALASRMREVMANPPQLVFARQLLGRGMTANEVWQLLMHDPAFVRVPEAFRIAVANAARQLAAQPAAPAQKPAAHTRRSA
jgi:hypothetical protein